MLRGSITALITPFADGALDEKAFSALIDWQIAEGTHGLVPVGTTGEVPTVTHEEHRRVIEVCVKTANHRVPVIAGAGANSTAEAVALTRYAETIGADAVLSVVPYYNKPTQEGMFRHFSAVAEATSLPIVLYSVPGRTVVDLTVETIVRLREAHDNIVAVKDATSDMGRASLQRLKLGSDFTLLSGEDMTALAYMAAGGHGCISVTANIAPRPCADLMATVLKGDYAGGLKIQDRLVPLHDAIFKEPGVAGAKHGLKLLGKLEEEVRFPLMPVTPLVGRAIRDAMVHAGVLN